MGFPECPYTHSPEGNPKQAHRLSLAPSGLGAMRAEFGENTPGSGRLLPPQSPCSPDPADRPCPAGDTTARGREVAATLLSWSLRAAGPGSAADAAGCSGRFTGPHPQPRPCLRYQPRLTPACPVSALRFGCSPFFSIPWASGLLVHALLALSPHCILPFHVPVCEDGGEQVCV